MTNRRTFLIGNGREVNGYAPEKSGILSDYIHFYVLLWTSGHQKEAFSTLLATDCSPGILNGYAPEYVEGGRGTRLVSDLCLNLRTDLPLTVNS